MEAGAFDPSGGPADGKGMEYEVGRIAGAMGVLVNEVASMRGEVSRANDQLGDTGERMTRIENEVARMADLQKKANHRTTKLENALSAARSRIATLETKWQMLTFLPRVLDKLAEHKLIGAALVAAVATAAGIAVGRVI